LTHLGQNPGVGPGNIDIMAHSLGNLVAMEALRYQANILPGVPLCHNYTTVEAAIWREAFEPQTRLHYDTKLAKRTDPWYVANSGFDKITYSVSRQRRMSWRFWFNQVSGGRVLTPTSALSGNLISSYAFGQFGKYYRGDYALDYAMRLNDYLLHGQFGNSYYRSSLSYRSNRTLVTTIWTIIRAAHELNGIPALMSLRDFFYNYTNLNYPVGEVQNPEAAVNINAVSDGWQIDPKNKGYYDHSALFYEDFWGIWKWYNDLAGHGTNVPANNPAFAIGDEK
ncbi:MAG: hypothetical protein ACP5O7_12915, partial [Phycisphaerae bacterium]